MRYLRIIISLLFVVSIGLFGFSEYKKHINTDDTFPVIEGDNDVLQIECLYKNEDLLDGIKAYDEKDGDLTDEILVGNFSSFYEKGKSNLDYVVFDSSNHPATFTRKVEFTDYHSPRIDLSSPLVFKEDSGARVSEYLSAYDMFDGDISGEIKLSDSSVDFSVIGDYKVKAEIINSFGDMVTISLPVHIVEKTDSTYEIKLKKNIIYLDGTEEFDPLSIVEKVEKSDGTEISKDELEVSSDVDMSKSGSYEIRYSYKYGEDQECVTWLTVVVE